VGLFLVVQIANIFADRRKMFTSSGGYLSGGESNPALPRSLIQMTGGCTIRYTTKELYYVI
jgi:hypothetical protein